MLGTFALYFRTPGRPTSFHWQLIDASTHVAAVAIVHDRESRELRASEERLRLAVTGGSDCHGPGVIRRAVGACGVTAQELDTIRRLAM